MNPLALDKNFVSNAPSFAPSTPSTYDFGNPNIGQQQLTSAPVSSNSSLSSAYSNPVTFGQGLSAFSNVKTTPTGGTVFPVNTPASTTPSLKNYTLNQTTTPAGGTVDTNGYGVMTGATPAPSYTINTSGAVDSTHLTGDNNQSSLAQSLKDYQDKVNALQQAQQYSPDYMNAYRSLQQAQLQDQNLQTSQSLGTNGMGGFTTDQANTSTGQQRQENALNQASAGIQLQAQALMRQGNIEGAKTLVEAYKPQNIGPGSSMVSPATGQTTYGGAGAYADYQAQQTYFNLAQNFPDASVPAYNPQLTPQQNLQQAQQLAANAPSFASKNMMMVTDSAGGIHLVNKNQVQTNADGSYSIQSATVGASQKADASSLVQQQNYLDTVTRSFNTANGTLNNVIIPFMRQYGINDSNIPIINQLENRVKSGLTEPGVLSAYKSNIAGLQAEYSQVLARGGARSVETDNKAGQLINENLAPKDIQLVASQLQKDAQQAITETQVQVNQIKSRLSAPQNGTVVTPVQSNPIGGHIDVNSATF